MRLNSPKDNPLDVRLQAAQDPAPQCFLLNRPSLFEELTQSTPGLDQIYQRLKDYQRVTTDGRKKFAYACLIFDSCTDWLAKYPDEHERFLVISLQDEAFTLIRSAGGRKWMTAIAKMSQDGTSKALDDHYSSELVCFADVQEDRFLMFNAAGAVGKLTNAARADKPEEFRNNVGAGKPQQDGERIFGRYKGEYGPQGMGPQSAQGLPTDPFVLSRVYQADPERLKLSPPRLIYMRKRMRELFRLFFSDHSGLAIFMTGEELHTAPSNQPPTHLWAMSDEQKYNHNLYVVDIAGVQKNSYYQVQHSSIFKGDPVLCAGNIYANKGVITKIDNGSGHYKPRPSHLKKACEWIWSMTMGKKKGMPEDAEVWVWGWAKNNDLIIVHFHDFVISGPKAKLVAYNNGKQTRSFGKLFGENEKDYRARLKLDDTWT